MFEKTRIRFNRNVSDAVAVVVGKAPFQETEFYSLNSRTAVVDLSENANWPQFFRVAKVRDDLSHFPEENTCFLHDLARISEAGNVFPNRYISETNSLQWWILCTFRAEGKRREFQTSTPSG